MKTLSKCCVRYFRELIYSGWIVAFVLLSVYDGETDYNECVWRFGVGIMITMLMTWLMSYSIRSYQQAARMKLMSAVVVTVVSVLFLIEAGQYDVLVPVYTIVCAVLFGVLCILIVGRCSRDGIYLEILRRRSPREYIFRKVDEYRGLAEDEELKLLGYHDAYLVVARYIKHDRFAPMAEVKFFSDSRYEDLWLDYFKRHSLDRTAQLLLLRQPNARELLSLYCAAGRRLCKDAELQLFKLEDPESWLSIYLCSGGFTSEEAELKLFDLPDAEKAVKAYRSKYVLFDEAFRQAQVNGWVK